MFKSVLGWIVDRPLVSHGLLGILYTVLLLLVVHPLAAFTIVSVFFYGREVGQLGHDLQAKGVSVATAWWKALLLNLDLWEVVQVLSPMISAGALSLAASVLPTLALPAHFV